MLVGDSLTRTCSVGPIAVKSAMMRQWPALGVNRSKMAPDTLYLVSRPLSTYNFARIPNRTGKR